MKKALAFLMAAVMLMSMLTACGNKDNAADNNDADNNNVNTEETDKAAADKVAALIDAIYVQERTEETDAQCEAAKAAWDAQQTAENAGELLLAAADAMRLAGVDAEEALTFAAKRFTQRLEADET